MARQTNQQNKETIETISQYDHIRLRARMYIGRLGLGDDPDDGIYNFIKEIVKLHKSKLSNVVFKNVA